LKCNEGCRFYSNTESKDFGRTKIIKCILSDITADSCSEGYADENRAILILMKKCNLDKLK